MAAIQHPPGGHDHHQQQGGGAMVAPEGFQVNDVRLAGLHAPEHAGVEGVAGSVTSFVRKLFQMVQGECDTVVGFVADGTAFEVKDPRRLEQDILPKYFRHSRFQSLVRQLNFYNFKKISKERSVWIYKHAYFRRDEPELLHALKRKTNQHGARIGDPNADDEMMAARVVIPRSLPHDRNNNPRPLGNSSSNAGGLQSPVAYPLHSHPPSSSSPFSRQQERLTNYDQGRAPPERHVVAGTKLQSNSRSGGGPSTGGVGGAAAAPCYSGRGGSNAPLSSSSSSRMSGFVPSWSGESVGSGGGAPAGRSVPAGVGAHEEHHDLYSDHRMHAAARALSLSASASRQQRSGATVEQQHPHPHTRFQSMQRQQQQRMSSMLSAQQHQPYVRHGPAAMDHASASPGDGDREERGLKRDAAAISTGGMTGASAVVGDHNHGNSPKTASNKGSDRRQALALYGLSALCQVASASAAAVGRAPEACGEAVEGGDAADSPAQQAAHRDGGGGDDDFGHERKKLCTRSGRVSAAANRFRKGYSGDERDDRDGCESSEEDGDDVEDGITSAERDDSVASSLCGDNPHESSDHHDSSHDHDEHHYAQQSPPESPAASTTLNGKNDRGYPFRNSTQYQHYYNRAEEFPVDRHSGEETSNADMAIRSRRGGVFDQAWNWGGAARRATVPYRGGSDEDEVDSSVGADGRRLGPFAGRRGRPAVGWHKGSGLDEESGGGGQGRCFQGSDGGGARSIEDDDAEDDDRYGRRDGGGCPDGTGGASRGAQKYQQTASDNSTTTRGTLSPRDMKADEAAEAAVGLTGIGAFLRHFTSDDDHHHTNEIAKKSSSIYLATVTNSGDDGLREMAVFCARFARPGLAAAPDTAPPAVLARNVSAFLEQEEIVTQDLRVYAEALDPAAADVVGCCARGGDERRKPPTAADQEKLLRIFCRYAACRLGRALEITSAIADYRGPSKAVKEENVEVARRISPLLDECRWKWWRAAVRFG